MSVLAEADAGIALVIRERCENPRICLLQAFTASHVADEITGQPSTGRHSSFGRSGIRSIGIPSFILKNMSGRFLPSHKSLRILMEELIRFDKTFFDLITNLERLYNKSKGENLLGKTGKSISK